MVPRSCSRIKNRLPPKGLRWRIDVIFRLKTTQSHAAEMIRGISYVDKISTVEDGALRHHAVSSAVGWIGNECLQLVILHCDGSGLGCVSSSTVHHNQSVGLRNRVHNG